MKRSVEWLQKHKKEIAIIKLVEDDWRMAKVTNTYYVESVGNSHFLAMDCYGYCQEFSFDYLSGMDGEYFKEVKITED